MSARRLPDREIRLRRRLDFAIAERDHARSELAAALMARRPRMKPRCVYCGAVTVRRACAAHFDLLTLDPYYNQGGVAVARKAA